MKPSEMSDQELTHAVAQEVMGWVLPKTSDILRNNDTGKEIILGQTFYVYYHLDDKLIDVKEWQPLTNYNHMMQVVERMERQGWKWSIDYDSVTFWKDITKLVHIEEIQIRVPDFGIEATSGFDSFSKLGRAVLEAALEAERGGDAK